VRDIAELHRETQLHDGFFKAVCDSTGTMQRRLQNNSESPGYRVFIILRQEITGDRLSSRQNFKPKKEVILRVREVMSKDVKIVSSQDTIQKAANLMEQIGCGALPVGENDRLVGVITDRDIALRAVAKGSAPNRCTVRDVMSSDIKYVFVDETTEAVAQNMSKLQVRRLPVLNRQKRLVGIVSLGDLALKHGGPVAASTLKEISKPAGGGL